MNSDAISEIIMLDSDNDMLLPEPLVPEKALKEGFDVERLVERPREEFVCPVCFGVVRLPRECQTCGVLICSKCEQGCRRAVFAFDMGLNIPQELSCPICRSGSPFRTPSKVLVDVILKLKIKCTNHQSGCSFTSAIKDIKEHEGVCQFKTIKCGNSILCQRRGAPADFIKLDIPKTMLDRPQYQKYREKGIYACSEVCRSVALMGLYLDLNDRDAVLKLYERALDDLDLLTKY